MDPSQNPTGFKPPEIAGYTYQNYIGRGIWGSVHKYQHNTTGSVYAFKFYDPTEFAKELQEKREQTIDDLMKYETLHGDAKVHPGLIHVSIENLPEKTVEFPDGVPYLKMEYFDRFLSDRLDELESEGKNMDLEEVLHIIKPRPTDGLVTGIKSMHTRVKRAHQDIKPNNMGYNSEGEVKTGDFGLATQFGRDREDTGYWLARPPERFGEGKAGFTDDIWNFGNTVYRCLKGKYILQDELENTIDPKKFVNGLYSDPLVWNARIDEKVDELNIPNPIKKLLKKTMYHTDHRIQDGRQLEKEVNKAIRKYENSKPKARIIQGTIAAIGATAFMGIATLLYAGHKEKTDLQFKTEQLKQQADLNEKIGIVKLYNAGKKYSGGHFTYTELQKLDGWVDTLGNKDLGIIAYFDANPHPMRVFEEIRKQGPQPDVSKVLGALTKYQDLYGAFTASNLKGQDNVARDVGRELKENVPHIWKETQELHQKKIDALENEATTHLQKAYEYREKGMHTGGVLGTSYHTHAQDHERKLVPLVDELHEKTGESKTAIMARLKEKIICSEENEKFTRMVGVNYVEWIYGRERKFAPSRR